MRSFFLVRVWYGICRFEISHDCFVHTSTRQNGCDRCSLRIRRGNFPGAGFYLPEYYRPLCADQSPGLQIREIVDYIARPRPEEERANFVQPFADQLDTAEGQKPFEKDEPRRAKVFVTVLDEVKDLGDGSDKGACHPV